MGFTILDYVIRVITIILNSTDSIEKAIANWHDENKLIQKMKDENRGPTKEEWEALAVKSQANTDELNSN